MFEHWIHWVLFNFGLAMLGVAILLTVIHWMTKQKTSVYEILYRWITLLPFGLTALYSFVVHAFYPVTAAASIGWQVSPFQYEVAMANLGFGLVAILAYKASYGFRLANVIGGTCWLWGDALGHFYQMAAHHNYTIGNAGSWLWVDIFVPLLLIIAVRKFKSR
jgi:hypothetical protein